MCEKTEIWVESAAPDRDLLETYEDTPQGMEDAHEHARKIKGYVVLAHFTFDYSELLEDYTGEEDEAEDDTE